MQFIDIALYAWVPVSLLLFTVLRPRHAVLASYIGAWLFLPIHGVKVNILPDITKVTISSFSVLLCVMIFDSARLMNFRPRWFDLPMFVWCLSPFVSSMVNKLGPWDGTSAVIAQLVLWGIPYYLGRCYFTDWEAFRELGIAMMIGGLVYVPLCLFEMKMSPVLHKWIYGRVQHSYAQNFRMGGWRPMVFMQHGLAVGFWMTACSLAAVWLWRTGSLKKLLGIPTGPLAAGLVVITVMCKATAGTLFLMAGLATLFWIRGFRNALPLWLLLAVAPVYMVARASDNMTGEAGVRLAAELFGENRAQSLQTRFNAENLLVDRALEAPFFGWGRWNPEDPEKPKWRVYDPETGKDQAITDGMWVITMGVYGLVGLVSVTLAILLPTVLLLWRVPAAYWSHPLVAAPAAMAVLLPLHMLDNLLNAMLNPLFVMIMGGLSALATSAAPAGATAVPRIAGQAAGVRTPLASPRPVPPDALPGAPARPSATRRPRPAAVRPV